MNLDEFIILLYLAGFTMISLGSSKGYKNAKPKIDTGDVKNIQAFLQSGSLNLTRKSRAQKIRLDSKFEEFLTHDHRSALKQLNSECECLGETLPNIKIVNKGKYSISN